MPDSVTLTKIMIEFTAQKNLTCSVTAIATQRNSLNYLILSLESQT